MTVSPWVYETRTGDGFGHRWGKKWQVWHSSGPGDQDCWLLILAGLGLYVSLIVLIDLPAKVFFFLVYSIDYIAICPSCHPTASQQNITMHVTKKISGRYTYCQCITDTSAAWAKKLWIVSQQQKLSHSSAPEKLSRFNYNTNNLAVNQRVE